MSGTTAISSWWKGAPGARSLAVVASCVGILCVAGRSRAQQSRPSDSITYERTEPDKRLVVGGIALFGLTYGPSLVIAGTSGYPADKNLYAPIVGPWVDLASRGPCGAGHEISCDTERAYKVLLVANGVGQALGALQIISGFAFPVHKTAHDATTVVVSPQLGFTMVGVQASGNFY